MKFASLMAFPVAHSGENDEKGKTKERWKEKK
jgi:hypothetical protein